MELSLFVLDAGIKLLEMAHRDLMYLSLTDYVQHKYAPGEAEARRFYQALDQRVGRLAQLGAVLALTADHGMNDKSDAAGNPNVVWLQDLLDARFGRDDVRVVCPITDAFVAHHGALGGFVRVWLRGRATAHQVMAALVGVPGIESVHDKAGACALFDLPADREADVVVISDAGTCIGARAADHDLSGLAGHRLRTHGGVSEAKVPIIISAPLNDAYRLKAGLSTLKSHQVFDFALNGTAAG
jgi:phosphonoacetate hydrolase